MPKRYWPFNDSNPAVASVLALTDQSEIVALANSKSRENARIAAVERLDDQALLTNLALNDPYPEVRFSALQRISDEAVLKQVAAQNRDTKILAAVATRLEMLRRIKAGAPSADVRTIAVMTDQPKLADLALHAADLEVQQAAIQRLASRSVLRQITVSRDQDIDVRIAAAARLDKTEAMQVAGSKELDLQVRLAAAKLLSKAQILRLTDPDILLPLRFQLSDALRDSIENMPVLHACRPETRSWLLRRLGYKKSYRSHALKNRRSTSSGNLYEVFCSQCGKRDYDEARRLTERDQRSCRHDWEKIDYHSRTGNEYMFGRKCRKCSLFEGRSGP